MYKMKCHALTVGAVQFILCRNASFLFLQSPSLDILRIFRFRYNISIVFFAAMTARARATAIASTTADIQILANVSLFYCCGSRKYPNPLQSASFRMIFSKGLHREIAIQHHTKNTTSTRKTIISMKVQIARGEVQDEILRFQFSQVVY